MSLYSAYWTEPSHFLGAAVGLSVLDIFTVAARFVARGKQGQPLGADDWLMIPATAFTVGIGICMIYGVSQHALAYPFEVPDEVEGNGLLVATRQISIEGQLQWAFIVLLPLALGCTKASFLFFYRRIFAVNPMSKTNIFLVGMLVFVLMWSTAFFFASLFECGTKFWAIWTSPIAFLENCVDDLKLSLAVAVTDLIIDIIILVIPIPLVWRLNLSLTKKVAIIGVFLLGLGTVAASVTRVVMTSKIVAEGYDPNIDAILLVSSFIYWGMVESGIAVCVACLPTLWFFVKGGPWGPVVRVVRSITASGASSIRLLRTRRSRPSVLDENDDGSFRRRHNATRPSASSETELRSVKSTISVPNVEGYQSSGIKVERDFRVERV